MSCNEHSMIIRNRAQLISLWMLLMFDLSLSTIPKSECCRYKVLGSRASFVSTSPLSFKATSRLIRQNQIHKIGGKCLSLPIEKTSQPLYAGGFGASAKKMGKKKNKKKKSFMDLDVKPKPQTQTETSEEQPKLDRFGLPIQTADNMFPLLPPETELIPALDSDGIATQEEIENVLKEHLKLNFSFLHGNNDDGENSMKVRLLHKSPPVLSIDNFFTPAECEEYIRITQPNDETKQNLEIQSATFSPLAKSKRTSTTWFCHFSQVPTLLTKVKHLLTPDSSSHPSSSSSTLNINQMEEPQIVRYRPGEEFSWHYDEIPFQQLQKDGSGGQRIATILIYLNSIEEGRGGGTVFRDLVRPGGSYEDKSRPLQEEDRLTMRPKTGSALVFFPAKLDGSPDDRTLHKGEIMKPATANPDGKFAEEKMIAQIWVHERDYQPQVPPGNTHEDALDPIKQKEIELGLSND